jgi:sodium pump decarboxylase gamma subunit
MSDLEFGLRITVVGMGIVFGVLLLLWALLSIAMRFEPVTPPPTVTGAATGAPAGAIPTPAAMPSPAPGVRIDGAEGLDATLVAAITVAVLHHAEARRLQAAPAMRSYWPGSLLFASRWVSAGRTRQAQSWRPRQR